MNKTKLKETYANHKIGNLQMNIYTDIGYVPYHWHDEYEFIRVISGTCECIINGESIILSKNEAILIGCGELHTVKFNESESDFSYFAIVVHPFVIFGTDCNRYYDPKIKFQRIFNDRNTLKLLDAVFASYSHKPHGYEMSMKANIINVFGTLYANKCYSVKESGNSKGTDWFSDTIEYIHLNYNKPISLEDLKKISYCSISYIIQIFKKNTGKTPIEYINSYRIYKSLELLMADKKSVLEISIACGFDNVGYFIRTFKKQMGLPPLQYKKKIKP